MGTVSQADQIYEARDARGTADPKSATASGWSDAGPSPGAFSQQSRPLTARALPDPDICRARTAGFGDYAECLVENPIQCPHALNFGYSHFCLHPQRNAMVGHTFLRV